MDNSQTMDVLKRLERGDINVNEADARLNEPPVSVRAHNSKVDFDLPEWMRRFWIFPLTAGIFIVLFGAWIIAATARANILWWLLGLPILLLGTLLLAISASTYAGHWIYINIEDAGKHRHKIRFGVPLPMGLLRLGLRIAKYFVPVPRARMNIRTAHSQIEELWENPDEFISALEDELAEGHGISIDVDDKDERVQVYIV